MRRTSPYSAVFASRTAFVGRELERARLLQSLNSSWQGRGALCLIAGEAGVGKTRLALEIALQAGLNGAMVAIGHCNETESAYAYLPFVEIIESLCGAQGSIESLREMVGADGPELARLYPHLRQILPDIAAPVELPAEQQQRFLFNSVCRFIDRLAKPRGLLLVIDNLQWADLNTLRLLEHLAARLPMMRACVIATVRDGELDSSSACAGTIERLPRQRLADSMTLARFSQAGVAAMLRALSAQEPPAHLVDTIHGETEGNPFFIEEVFNHLLELGKLFDGDGRFRPCQRIGELEVPASVGLMIGRRLDHLEPLSREVLSIAAIVGREFDIGLLAAVAEIARGELLAVIDELLRARLIAPGTGEPEAPITFAHELIRQTVLKSLSPPRRQELHLRVAQAMERSGSSSSDHDAALAEHYYRAGSCADPGQSARRMIPAAVRALDAAAFSDAARLLERAMSLWPARDHFRADLCEKFGLAERGCRRWSEAFNAWNESLAIYHELGDAPAIARSCYFISNQLAGINRYSEAIRLAARGLESVEEGPGSVRCRLLALSGASSSFIGEYDRGERLTTEAVAMARELNDDALTGYVLFGRAAHHRIYHQFELAAKEGRRAAALLLKSGELWDLSNLFNTIVQSEFSLGRFDEMSSVASQATALCERLGNEATGKMIDNCLMLRKLFESGALSDYNRNLRRIVEQAPETLNLATSYYHLGIGEFRRGNLSAAIKLVQEGVQLARNVPKTGGWALEPLFLAYAGEGAQAQKILETRRADFAQAGRPNIQPAWAIALIATEAFYVAGERRRAAELYPVVLDAIATGTVIRSFDFRLVQTVAGIAAAAGENWQAAQAHFDEALKLSDSLPIRLEKPEAERFYAQMLIERGVGNDPDRARAMLRHAIADYRKLGMPRHRRIAERMLRSLGTERRHGTESKRSNVFRREGDTWYISWSGKQARMKDRKGLNHLERLLHSPGKEFSALELAATIRTNGSLGNLSTNLLSVGADSPLRVSHDLGDAGAMLDSSAKHAYRKRLSELRTDLEESERLNDPGAIVRARNEIDAITSELSRAVGLGTRDRKAISHVERARASTTLAIRTAISAISKLHPELGHHLDATIRTGKTCSYHLDSGSAVAWLT